jgi:hypothetical protein
MKARVEVRHYALHAMYDTVHRALINRYTHICAWMCDIFGPLVYMKT